MYHNLQFKQDFIYTEFNCSLPRKKKRELPGHFHTTEGRDFWREPCSQRWHYLVKAEHVPLPAQLSQLRVVRHGALGMDASLAGNGKRQVRPCCVVSRS